MRAGGLDRRVQFERGLKRDNGFEEVLEWQSHGAPVWSSCTPVRDGERWASGHKEAFRMARFVVRYSSFTAGVTPKDRLVCEGVTYEIEGIKEIGRREGFEITAVAGPQP